MDYPLKPDEAFTLEKPRMIFHIQVSGVLYEVYDIAGKEHSAPNGEPNTWWLLFSDRREGKQLDPYDPNLVPWNASMGRLCWDISFKQDNHMKYKWDSWSCSHRTLCEMRCNGKLVYSFGTIGGSGGLAYAMAKSQELMVKLTEHTYDFLDPATNEGMKIYFKGLPATIRVNKSEPWRIHIVPDYTDVPKDRWWETLLERSSEVTKNGFLLSDEEREDWDEYIASDSINWGDALSDQHIGWFRQ